MLFCWHMTFSWLCRVEKYAHRLCLPRSPAQVQSCTITECLARRQAEAERAVAERAAAEEEERKRKAAQRADQARCFSRNRVLH